MSYKDDINANKYSETELKKLIFNKMAFYAPESRFLEWTQRIKSALSEGRIVIVSDHGLKTKIFLTRMGIPFVIMETSPTLMRKFDGSADSSDAFNYHDFQGHDIPISALDEQDPNSFAHIFKNRNAAEIPILIQDKLDENSKNATKLVSSLSIFTEEQKDIIYNHIIYKYREYNEINTITDPNGLGKIFKSFSNYHQSVYPVKQISQNKQYQQSLQIAFEQLSSLLKQIPDDVFTQNSDKIIEYFKKIKK